MLTIEQRRKAMNQLPEVVPAHSRQRGLVGCLLCLAGVVLGSANAAAQLESPPARQPQGKPASESPSSPVFTEEREAAALTFVRKNRPELLAMLEGLKLRRPADYQRAVSDLFRTSEMLTSVRQEDPGRYELALKGWQAEMHAGMLFARLVPQPGETKKLEAELKQAVEKVVELQIEQTGYHVRRMEGELERLRKQQQEQENRRAEMVRERMAAMLQAVQQQRSVRGGHHE
jgi:hypothetical protein